MLRRKVFYIAILITTIFFAIMYPDPVPPVIVTFELLVLPLCLAVVFITVGCTEGKLWIREETVLAGDAIHAVFTIKNHSFLPVPYMELVVAFSNKMEPQKKIRRMFVKLPAREQVEVEMEIYSDYCGSLDITLMKWKIYDPILLFHWRKRRKKKVEVTVLPRLEEMKVEITENCRQFCGEGEDYDSIKAGEDPSEILRLREYRPGDRLSQVHWKMSARMDTLLIKERALPLGFPVGIFLDVRHHSLESMDALLTLLYSLSYSLLVHNCRHFIWWYKKEKNEIRTYQISKEEELFFVIQQLLAVPKQSYELNFNSCEEKSFSRRFYCLYFLSTKLGEGEIKILDEWKAVQKRTLFLIDKKEEEISAIKSIFPEEIKTMSQKDMSQKLSGHWLEV